MEGFCGRADALVALTLLLLKVLVTILATVTKMRFQGLLCLLKIVVKSSCDGVVSTTHRALVNLLPLGSRIRRSSLVASASIGCQKVFSLACLVLILDELGWLARVGQVISILLDHDILHLHELFGRDGHLLLLLLGLVVGQNE